MKQILTGLIALVVTQAALAGNFQGSLKATGNVQYNYDAPTINAIGTLSLDGITPDITTFPKIITLQGSLNIAALSTTGSASVDLTPSGFAHTPLAFVTATNGPNLGFVNLHVSNLSSTSVTVNALVQTAPLLSTAINFCVLAIGY